MRHQLQRSNQQPKNNQLPRPPLKLRRLQLLKLLPLKRPQLLSSKRLLLRPRLLQLKLNRPRRLQHQNQKQRK